MLRAFFALTAAVLMTGCMIVQAPLMGTLYTDVYGPVDAEGSLGSREGKACAQSLLGLIATGDASIKEAARNGGISNVTSVDHYSRNLLGIVGEFCTIVRGS